MSDWVRTSRSLECPVCKKNDWCTMAVDGGVIKCMRVPSEDECKTGGWFHFDKPTQLTICVPPPVPKADASALAKDLYFSKHAPGARQKLSKILGVSLSSLEELRVGWGSDPSGRVWWSFPSRDASGRIIGIIRRYEDGSKYTYKGTSNGGVFAKAGWWKTPGVVLIVEGGSDVAAALTHGLCAIGRPSNIGGVAVIRDMLIRYCKGRPVIVVGENDEQAHKRGLLDYCHADCKGCGHCFPGKFGAEHVASCLGVGYCMPPFPFKDFREAAGDLVWLELLRSLSSFRA